MDDTTPQELKPRLEEKDPTIHLIDVREPDEHAAFNIGGDLIPLGELPNRLSELADTLTDQEVVVYCRSGRRSAMAKHMLEQAGLSNVRNLQGGMLAWQEMEEK